MCIRDSGYDAPNPDGASGPRIFSESGGVPRAIWDDAGAHGEFHRAHSSSRPDQSWHRTRKRGRLWRPFACVAAGEAWRGHADGGDGMGIQLKITNYKNSDYVSLSLRGGITQRSGVIPTK